MTDKDKTVGALEVATRWLESEPDIRIAHSLVPESLARVIADAHSRGLRDGLERAHEFIAREYGPSAASFFRRSFALGTEASKLDGETCDARDPFNPENVCRRAKGHAGGHSAKASPPEPPAEERG
jgi:hypothetical protein